MHSQGMAKKSSIPPARSVWIVRKLLKKEKTNRTGDVFCDQLRTGMCEKAAYGATGGRSFYRRVTKGEVLRCDVSYYKVMKFKKDGWNSENWYAHIKRVSFEEAREIVETGINGSFPRSTDKNCEQCKNIFKSA